MKRLSSRPPLADYFGDLWGRREFMLMVPVGDLRQRNMNSALGSLWHLLNPLFLAAVYYLVFGVLLGARDSPAVYDNYVGFLVVGLFVFYYTQKSMQNGARTVVNNVKMLHNLNFPAAVLPISSVLTETFAHLPAIIAMAVILAATGVEPQARWVLVLALLPLQFLLNLGLAFFTSRLTVHFRDTEQFLPYVMRIWFYLSGILFTVDRVPDGWPTTLFNLNPVYAFIRVNREILFNQSVETEALLIAAAWAIGAFVIGLVFFWRFEGEYSNAA